MKPLPQPSTVFIFAAENSKITELNANVDSYMNFNGNYAYDAISLFDNARIDLISGGEYKTYYTDGYIQSWLESNPKSVKELISYTVALNGEGVSIGKISGGTFLSVMDKANNGTPIHVNSGKVELISGGYFGFVKKGLTEPGAMLFANTANGGAIEKITGGTFEKGTWKGYGCAFENIVADSGCQAIETGETVDVAIQFSTKVTTYTLKVFEVVAK